MLTATHITTDTQNTAQSVPVRLEVSLISEVSVVVIKCLNLRKLAASCLEFTKNMNTELA